MNATHEAVAANLSEIEAEMRQIGMWQKQPPPPESLVITQAFSGDKLAFEQWLQFIFIPRVRQIISEKSPFPSGSQVSQQAFREWKMWGDVPNVDHLLELLQEFDKMFG